MDLLPEDIKDRFKPFWHNEDLLKEGNLDDLDAQLGTLVQTHDHAVQDTVQRFSHLRKNLKLNTRYRSEDEDDQDLGSESESGSETESIPRSGTEDMNTS